MKNLLSSALLPGLALAAATCTAPQSCEGLSGSNPWTVKDFDYHAEYIFSTPSHQNSHGYVSFSLYNIATSYEAKCSATSSQLQDFFYGNMVYNCSVPSDDGRGNSRAGDSATFTFSRPTQELKINQTWSCPSKGSHWSGVGGVKLNLTCTETKWQNPEWQMGEFYSTDEIKCDKVTVDVPKEVTGPETS